MIKQAIRFYSVNRDGSEKLNHGTAWLTEDGDLDYANDSVREMMAPMVARVGPEKAFVWFSGWGNGYMASEVVKPTAAR
jgi:hypothetical protein